MSPSNKRKRQVGGTAKADKPTGTNRRRQARAWESDMDARTYRPEQLLDPAQLLARFTERARELVDALPADHRPGGAEVATALRRAVLDAFRTREEYVARLAETDSVNWATQPPALSMRRGIRAMLVDSGVRVVENCEEQELFVVVEGDGDAFEVVRPAYVDQATGKLILSGQLRRVPAQGTRADSDAVPGATQGEEKA
ncbi:hypothetical protein ACFS5L_09665 [Streptomyces phyllanthi]|uniref:Uncharacterized protein n=1 Tax=Streptomyces phyllanthi TaxID=1803180 RepID=A0A5N8W617_9ACTN|nr:hypothetical protein [Streptomyces phyllanthi]MPY42920.1 hypothetical protein [Streptomyces phyllanthi]